jgi:outer membrane protein assembly factor BamB
MKEENKMKKTLLTLVALTLTSTLTFAGEWQYWRGQQSTGITSEKVGLIGTAESLWEKDIGMGYAGASIYKNLVLTSGNDGSSDIIYCFSAKDGKVIWEYKYTEEPGKNYKGTRATPVTDGKNVYTFSRSGRLIAVNLKTGNLVWENNLKEMQIKGLGWGLSSSVIIYNNMLLLQAGESGMAFNPSTGKVLWGEATGTSSYSTPVVFKYNNKEYVAFLGEILNIKDVTTGKLVASYEWKAKYNINAADPVILNNGNNIFLSTGYGVGCIMLKFNGSSLKSLWQNKNMNAQFSTPIYYNGIIYGSDGNAGRGKLVAISPKTGDVIWKDETSKFCSIIIAGKTLISIDERGTLSYYDVSKNTLNKLGSQKMLRDGGKDWTAPSLSNGQLYLKNSNGQFKCIKVK